MTLHICGRFVAIFYLCGFPFFRPEEEETFLSVSAKMAKHQTQLADIPETIKVPTWDECNKMTKFKRHKK